MILSSHQPNFMPYMGFFYKMFCSDVFTISDSVQFSRRGFQNYNFIDMNGERLKITVPVKSHVSPINETEIHDWDRTKVKLEKTMRCTYGKASHFGELQAILNDVFNHEYKYISQLNLSLIKQIQKALNIETKIVEESKLGIDWKDPNEDICSICNKLGANVYMSGRGAEEYIDEEVFKKNGINILWSNYEDKWKNMSVVDYIANNGFCLPHEFIEMKENLWKK